MDDNGKKGDYNRPGSRKKFYAPVMAIGGAAFLSLIALLVAISANKPKPAPEREQETIAESLAPIAEAVKPPAEASAPASAEAPSPSPSPEPAPPPRLYDLTALRDQYNNDDIIGYLDIPGTSVSYPVMGSKDNVDYLKRDEYGNASNAGSIFMDFENRADRLNYNTILYGHNMKKNIMFHAIRYYVLEKDYWEKHPYIIFETEQGPNVWEVFAAFRASTKFNYIQTMFFTESDFLKLVGEMTRRSIIDTGVAVGAGDKILTLSTCSNEDPDTRFVVEAVRVKDVSKLPEDVIVSLYSQEFYEELHSGGTKMAREKAVEGEGGN